jgi:hypothetical protein
MAMLRRLPRLSASVAAAGGIALSAYVLNTQPSIRAAEPESHIFVINGCAHRRVPISAPPLGSHREMLVSFYMAMREKYTKPGESIHYYLVE